MRQQLGLTLVPQNGAVDVFIIDHVEPPAEDAERLQLFPLPAPISLNVTNDSKKVFELIAEMGNLTATFSPNFTSRRITVHLTNAAPEQALDAVSVEAGASWRPVIGGFYVSPKEPAPSPPQAAVVPAPSPRSAFDSASINIVEPDPTGRGGVRMGSASLSRRRIPACATC